MDREDWCTEVHGVAKSQTWLRDWTDWLAGGGSDGKKSVCIASDLGSTTGLGRSPGRGHSNPLQYSCLDNSMEREVWWTIVCWVPASWTWLSDCVDHNKLWKILQEMGIQDHVICLLINLYAGQEATVRTGHGKTDRFQIRKLVRLGCILSPHLSNLYTEYITRNAGLDEAKAGTKIAWRNINNFRYADDTTLMAKSEEELKSLLMKVKEESEKYGLKLNIQKTKIMASCPITSWQIDGEAIETMRDFIWGGSKITADCDCSHEIKRLAPWKKSYDQPAAAVKSLQLWLLTLCDPIDSSPSGSPIPGILHARTLE